VSVRRVVRLPLEELQPYLLTPPDPPAPLEWSRVFGNEAPVEIEIGCGKGLFLITAGQERPGVNFLGIEIERKYHLFTANRVAKRMLRNIRLACADARSFLRDCVPARSVRGVHVYFPDPWWKKRHHKRRLFTEEFAGECARVLQEGGQLEVMSDVPEYFAVIKELLAKQPRLMLQPEAEHAGEYRTNFERKYRLAGKPIHGASYRVTAAS
jgi:tRNA (guanine-N7-)-methyltransferase